MTVCFDSLPVELKFKIFADCTKDEWRNFALVNKHYCQLIRPAIWETVTKSWHTLESPCDVEKYKDHLLLTTNLLFEDSRPMSQRNLEPLRQGYKNFQFYEILHHCNSSKVDYLSFSEFIVAGGLQLATKKLPKISKLVMDGIQGESWKFVFHFYCLKELLIYECNIDDDDFAVIRNITGLMELVVRRCSSLKGSFFAHVSPIALGLDNFEFEDFDHNVPERYYENLLKDLGNVRKLSLEYTRIEDSLFCQMMTMQMMTNIACCENITDLGLLRISKVKSLQNLDIGFLTWITDEGIVHLKNLDSLRVLDMYYCEELTDNTLEFISRNLKKLEHVAISCERFTANGLNHLLALKELKDIEYDKEMISDKDIESFRAKLKDQQKIRRDHVHPTL